MNILYISSVPSDKQFKYMKSMLKPNIDTANYGMQESGFKFHSLIMNGFLENKETKIYSLIGRPASFRTHKNIIWKKTIEKKEDITYHHIGFINLPFIKHIVIGVSYFFLTLKWLNIKSEEKFIIMDAAYVTVLPFVILATKIKKCKTISIFCDIYEYMGNVKDSREKSSFVHVLIAKFMKKMYLEIDGYVFLTEAMNSIVNIKNHPYIIIEGLVDYKMDIVDNDFNKKNKKDIIMYAGALRKKYGLDSLVEGFHEYDNDNAELWIYGAGDYVGDIDKMALIDKRIKYFGVVANSEIIKREIEATLLVNPRDADQEFTKYSFPSKNMEYMVSGTPILTTKLPGMPKEYYKYVYIIDKKGKDGIKEALEITFQNSKNKLHNKGLLAKEFVLNKKNNIIQSRKILELKNNILKGVVKNVKEI